MSTDSSLFKDPVIIITLLCGLILYGVISYFLLWKDLKTYTTEQQVYRSFLLTVVEWVIGGLCVAIVIFRVVFQQRKK
jgi:hypothetical protein